MELLQRITVQLDDDHDAILSARLTCKTLEAAIFDDFVDTFFNPHQYCILSRRSLLRLHELLTSSSRLMARMQKVTFTSCFFANTQPKQIQLALNQNETDLKAAQIAAMKDYSQGQVEMLEQQQLLLRQLLPDAELIRCVLEALRAKCPGVELNLSIWKNAKSSIPVHAEVLGVVVSLGIALSSLAVAPNTLASGDFDTLQSGLPACSSSLVKLCFVPANPARNETDISPLGLAFPGYHVLQSVLSSANALRDLTLDFGHDWTRRPTPSLTPHLLASTSHPLLQSLCLRALVITEKDLLELLAGWAGQLEKINFRRVYLMRIAREGWSDVLRTLATMPQLQETRLCLLDGRRDPSFRTVVNLRKLQHGEIMHSHTGVRGTYNDIIFRGEEVKAGLHELLERGLEYH